MARKTRRPSAVSKALEKAGSRAAEEAPKPEGSRRRAGNPALAAVSGEMSSVEVNHMAREEMERHIVDLQSKVDTVRRKMPVSGLEVRFRSEWIPADKITVSPRNMRMQSALNRFSVRDIFGSIERSGQQDPGMVRPLGDGTYELVFGSRRLWCAKELGREYWTLIGDVPDSDVGALAKMENEAKPISHYERACAYKAMVEEGLYANWSKLGVAEDVPQSTWSTLKALAELDPILVQAFPDVGDIPFKFGRSYETAAKKSPAQVKAAIDAARSIRSGWSEEGAAECPTGKEVASSILAAFKKKPRRIAPKVHNVAGGGSIKVSVSSSGSTKVEFIGVDEGLVRAEIDTLLTRIAKQSR